MASVGASLLSIRGDMVAALTMVARVLRRRPLVFAIFLPILILANPFRLWVAANMSANVTLLRTAGWLFLIVRTFVHLWLHVATTRLLDQPTIGWRAAFAVPPVAAGWFHLVAGLSLATVAIRLLVGQGVSGGFVPAVQTGGTVIDTAFGLSLAYLLFLLVEPGFIRVLLRGEATSLRWSLGAIRGQYLRCYAVLMIIAYPPALARAMAFGGVRQDGPPAALLVALVDGAMSVLLMLLACSVYLMAFRRAEAHQG
ncbi:hypothetical protein [Sphingomonas jatrophae]|uniref:Uncharacterized protein n=1 Tax=Sphingomonas jatrophae TaxID=1166337 RepID=A0A1I6JLY3_9SPHN|nr:hypothetical protein [Sphingomonas jatrophae]SFR79911.1 hypothetical protein SAMN05192580_0489 [Sphingomonas jatrophae]